MINYLLLISSAILGMLKNIYTKKVKNKANTLYDIAKSNVFSYAVAFLTVFTFYAVKNGVYFKGPLIISALYALFTLFSQISIFLAMDCGPLAISTLFFSCGFIIPTLYGSIRYNEKISILQILGLLLILISFVLSTNNSDGKRLSVKWLIFALSGLIFSGLVGVCQKIFVKEYSDYSQESFLCLAFIIVILLSCILFTAFAIGNRKNNNEESEKTIGIKRFVFSSVILGVLIGLVNKVNTFISGVFVSAISFPIINGGTIVLTALVSSIVLKERLSVKQKIGIILGFVAIIIIAI